MYNRFASTLPQENMRHLFPKARDPLGNLAPLPEVYPDSLAPFLRNADEGQELVMARWGLPTPFTYLAGKKADRGVTNVRNTRSPRWRRWFGPEQRCLVPFTRFAEPDHEHSGNAWFAFPDERPAFFAGIQVTEWKSIRRVKDGKTADDPFGFLN